MIHTNPTITMKRFLSIIAVPALAVSSHSQEYQAPAVLSSTDGETRQVWITAATKTQIRYKTTPVSTDFLDGNIADFATIYLMEPAEYSAAIDLYEGRDYAAAREKFAALKVAAKPVAALKDNHHTLAAFHEMECMRKLGDYAGLATALQAFVKEPLTRDHHLRQLDLYVMWDAVRSESWDRLLAIASERDGEILPGYQRAQVAYCKGLALDKLGRSSDALLEYAVAITADGGASERVTQDAVLNSLAIYSKDKEVQIAITNWGTDDENKNSAGYSRLVEAGGLARFYVKFLSAGKPLAEDYRKLLKYGEKPKPVAEAKPAGEAKPGAPAKPPEKK